MTTARRSSRSARSRSSGCSGSRTRIAARSSSTRALRANTSNGEAPMRSVVAAFSLLRQVQGDKGEWAQLLDLADAVIVEERERRRQAVRRDPGRPHRVRQAQRRRPREAATSRSPRRSRRTTRASRTSRNRGSARRRSARVGLAAGDAGRRRQTGEPKPDRRPEGSEEGAQGSRGGAKARSRGRSRGRSTKPTPKRAAARSRRRGARPRRSRRRRSREGGSGSRREGRSRKAAADKAAAEQAAAKAAADKPRPMPQLRRCPPISARRWTRRSTPKVAPTRASLGWKDVVGKFPTERAPRRELARVLRDGAVVGPARRCAEGRRGQGRADAGADKATVFLELAETYGKLNNDNQVIAALNNAIQHDPTRPDAFDQLVALYETKKRWPDLVKVLRRRPSARSTATRRSRSTSRSRTSTSSGSRTRPRRSRRSRKSSSSIRTTRRRSITCSRSTRSAATGRS